MCGGQWSGRGESDLVLTLELPIAPCTVLQIWRVCSLLTCFTHLIYSQLATAILTHCQNLFLWEQERVTQGLRDSLLFSPFERSISTLQIYTHHSFPLTSCQQLCHFDSLGYCLLPASIIPLPYSGPRNFQVKCAERIRSYFNIGFKK